MASGGMGRQRGCRTGELCAAEGCRLVSCLSSSVWGLDLVDGYLLIPRGLKDITSKHNMLYTVAD